MSRPERRIVLQRSGAQRRRWIENPSEPACCIPRAMLAYSTLRNTYGILGPVKQKLDQLELPHEFNDILDSGLMYRQFAVWHNDMSWLASTGSGVILIDTTARRGDSNAPHISEITTACYQRHFAIAGLKHIFITRIANPETASCIKKRIQTSRRSWPSCGEQEWAFGTPEYDALLGTRLGKVAAYSVLGAFDRGTRRIARIVTWPGRDNSPNMKFDIETIEAVSSYWEEALRWVGCATVAFIWMFLEE